MANIDQPLLFPEEKPPVRDLDEVARHIAQHARPVSHTRNVSEAARDQGWDTPEYSASSSTVSITTPPHETEYDRVRQQQLGQTGHIRERGEQRPWKDNAARPEDKERGLDSIRELRKSGGRSDVG